MCQIKGRRSRCHTWNLVLRNSRPSVTDLLRKWEKQKKKKKKKKKPNGWQRIKLLRSKKNLTTKKKTKKKKNPTKNKNKNKTKQNKTKELSKSLLTDDISTYDVAGPNIKEKRRNLFSCRLFSGEQGKCPEVARQIDDRLYINQHILKKRKM